MFVLQHYPHLYAVLCRVQEVKEAHLSIALLGKIPFTSHLLWNLHLQDHSHLQDHHLGKVLLHRPTKRLMVFHPLVPPKMTITV